MQLLCNRLTRNLLTRNHVCNSLSLRNKVKADKKAEFYLYIDDLYIVCKV